MSFMTLSSKTWTQVKMIVKTWQPQVWNQVLNCDIFLQLHVLKSWQWLHYSRLGFPSLESFWGKNFNIRPLPRIMSFMTWPSKTWTQVNMIVKTWQPPQFWNLAFFLRLGNIPCLEMLHFLATPCPQVLTMIALDIQDLAFQVLKPFGAKNFNIWLLPRIMSFMTWSSKTRPQVNMIVKTWQPQVWNLTFLFATILQLHVLKSWQRLHHSRLGFPSLETFCRIDFQQSV